MTKSTTINLNSARKRLVDLRDSVMIRKEALAKHLTQREQPLPADLSDQAIELENDETMVAIDAELDVELRNIFSALKRIDAGNYEFCAKCAGEIAEARLDALPEVALCLDCAEALETSA